MQIPLDYYRILGLPIAASHDQLQQAYRDRLLQLPRREYSQAAIAARQQLVETAYQILRDPKQRTEYDSNYFAYNYARSPQEELAPAAAQPQPQPTASLIVKEFQPPTPSIEIPAELFVGALLSLQELGEYELVLNLGRAHLNEFFADAGSENNILARSPVFADILLTVVLAYLELGREQWQQGQYETAANSLESGEQLLVIAGILPSVRNEIQADICKLRPYRILGLLSQPENHVAQRRLGLKLLQDLLQQRGGIDGTGDDGSGLSLDDFLRFIQQLRSDLTVAEQQRLFAAESQRPSPVATYLTVYALIAQGFTQRQPAAIAQAQELLMRLGERQDVYLEKAVTSLLLGQTAAATQALERAQEHDVIDFIEDNSQGAPDLLPGLCLYTERWLQGEVFPEFRDLKNARASLQDYFADAEVQSDLESRSSLHAQPQATTATIVGASPAQPMTQHPHRMQSVVNDPESINVGLPPAERVSKLNQSRTTSARVPTRRPRKRQQRNQKRKLLTLGSTRELIGDLLPKRTRLALFGLSGVLGIVILLALLGQTFAWIREAFDAEPLLTGEQPLVYLDRPPLPIPDSTLVTARGAQLNKETAPLVIQNWLSTKAEAFGANYRVERLTQILTEPALSQWRRRVAGDRVKNRYRQFQHQLKVNSVTIDNANSNRAQINATVSEVAQVYQNGKLNKAASYADQNLRIRYDLERIQNQWRIRAMTILN